MYRIFDNISYEILNEGEKFEIAGIEYDSRKIRENFVFIAMTGNNVDGHDFIQKAIDSGAKMIVAEKKVNVSEYSGYEKVSFILIENVRKSLGIIASNYYNYPQNKLKIVGITGTNGKTTSSYILENILEKTARIGTTGNRILDEEFETVNTTPESLELIKLINESVKRGVEYFIMEVSSHALEIGRVNMLEFDSAIFTNLTQDHLDFHGTMENYFNAKRKIFSMLRKNGTGIINIDDEYGKVIYNNIVSKKRSRAGGNDDKLPKVRAYSFGEDETADYRLCQVDYHAKADFVGISCKIKVKTASDFNVNFGIPGKFNALNGTVAVALAHSLGIDSEILENSLLKLRVNGRMEVVYKSDKYIVLVDYAHNALSMESLLSTLRAYNPKRLVVVFGCGGNRSKDRRYSMGEIAGKNADFSIVTADNSRFERVEDIIADIRGSIEKTGGSFIEIPDRREAIYYAVENACEGDIIAIIGKGHEDYQEINGVRQHFLDSEVVKEALRARKAIKMKGLDSGN